MSDGDDRERIDLKSTNIQRPWIPKLIELTKAPHPDVDDGSPTRMYIAPLSVLSIERGLVQWEAPDGTKHQPQECTVIVTTRGTAQVLEAPDEVARLVNSAVGLRP